MSCPDTPAFRMRYPAAASPPNPPPTICVFICLLPELGVGRSSKPEPAQASRVLNRHTNVPPTDQGLTVTPWPLIFAAVATSGYIYLFDFYPWRNASLSGALQALVR